MVVKWDTIFFELRFQMLHHRIVITRIIRSD